MNRTRCSIFGVIVATMLFLLSGCEKEETNSTSQSTPGSTKILEAAELVGYDGKKLRRSVDGIKAANERHNQELEKAVGSGPDQ